VFNRGEANGDTILIFPETAQRAGDQIQFVRVRKPRLQGRPSRKLTPSHWKVHAADGSIEEVVTIANGAGIHASDVLFVP